MDSLFNPTYASVKVEPIDTTLNIYKISALKFVGGVLFGSQALGVFYAKSDTDIAILKEQFESMYPHPKEQFSINKYFKVTPSYGVNYLVRTFDNLESLDILVIEHQEHLEVIRKSVEDLQKLPKKDLRMKKDRIRLFQEALVRNGFTRKNYMLRMKRWMHKNFNNLLST